MALQREWLQSTAPGELCPVSHVTLPEEQLSLCSPGESWTFQCLSEHISHSICTQKFCVCAHRDTRLLHQSVLQGWTQVIYAQSIQCFSIFALLLSRFPSGSQALGRFILFLFFIVCVVCFSHEEMDPAVLRVQSTMSYWACSEVDVVQNKLFPSFLVTIQINSHWDHQAQACPLQIYF